MAEFSVVLFTTSPPHQSVEPGAFNIRIDGRELLLRAIELFLNRDNIKQVILAVLPENLEEVKRKHGAHLAFTGVKLVAAGPKWIDQMAAAADKIAAESTHVIVHDAARCVVPYTDIDALIQAADASAIASLTCPLRAPLLEVDEGGNAIAMQPPGSYRQLLMPQVFSKVRFLKMASAKQLPHASEFVLVKGSHLNIRPENSQDGTIIKAMINLLPKPKVKGPSNPFEEAQW